MRLKNGKGKNMRLIDADVLKQHIDKLPALPDGNFAGNHSALKALINMQPTIELSTNCSENPNNSDCISRQAAIELIERMKPYHQDADDIAEMIANMPSAQPETEKYEYHYDHTDCIWYRPEARNRCPTTCAQYRDGWNDAMNYIFRDGEGYRPFRRDKKYEG